MEGKEELEERREGVTASSSMELDLSERERVEELERLDKVGGCSLCWPGCTSILGF